MRARQIYQLLNYPVYLRLTYTYVRHFLWLRCKTVLLFVIIVSLNSSNRPEQHPCCTSQESYRNKVVTFLRDPIDETVC